MSDNLQRLRDERAGYVAEAREILKKIDTDKRDITEDETSKMEDLHAKAERLQARIVLEEKTAGLESSLEQSNRVIGAEPATDRSRPKKEIGGDQPAGTFKSFGEQLQSIAGSVRSGVIDPRLLNQRALSSNVPSEGGFLIEQQFATGLLDRSLESGQLAKRVRTINIGANSNSLSMYAIAENSRATGSRYGGVSAYWLAEAEEKPQSSPTFKKLDVKLGKLGAVCKVPDELLQDATALESVVRDAFVKEMAFQLDDAVINGNGAGVTPLGILNSGALISVAKESGQANDTIKYENVLKVYSRFYAPNLQGAVWVAHRSVIPQLALMNMAVGTGGAPVYLPANGAAGQMFQTLFGLPILFLEQAPPLGDKGDLMLVDPQEYLLIKKGDVQFASSIHVYFTSDQTAFRFVLRANGTPLWDTPLTPYKGTETTSPYVAIADR